MTLTLINLKPLSPPCNEDAEVDKLVQEQVDQKKATADMKLVVRAVPKAYGKWTTAYEASVKKALRAESMDEKLCPKVKDLHASLQTWVQAQQILLRVATILFSHVLCVSLKFAQEIEDFINDAEKDVEKDLKPKLKEAKRKVLESISDKERIRATLSALATAKDNDKCLSWPVKFDINRRSSAEEKAILGSINEKISTLDYRKELPKMREELLHLHGMPQSSNDERKTLQGLFIYEYAQIFASEVDTSARKLPSLFTAEEAKRVALTKNVTISQRVARKAAERVLTGKRKHKFVQKNEVLGAMFPGTKSFTTTQREKAEIAQTEINRQLVEIFDHYREAPQDSVQQRLQFAFFLRNRQRDIEGVKQGIKLTPIRRPDAHVEVSAQILVQFAMDKADATLRDALGVGATNMASKISTVKKNKCAASLLRVLFPCNVTRKHERFEVVSFTTDSTSIRLLRKYTLERDEVENRLAADEVVDEDGGPDEEEIDYDFNGQRAARATPNIVKQRKRKSAAAAAAASSADADAEDDSSDDDDDDDDDVLPADSNVEEPAGLAVLHNSLQYLQHSAAALRKPTNNVELCTTDGARHYKCDGQKSRCSVSQLADAVNGGKFDAAAAAVHVARARNVTPESVRQQWEIAANAGTALHHCAELIEAKKELPPDVANCKEVKQLQQVMTNLQNELIDRKCEERVFDKVSGVAGTIDYSGVKRTSENNNNNNRKKKKNSKGEAGEKKKIVIIDWKRQKPTEKKIKRNRSQVLGYAAVKEATEAECEVVEVRVVYVHPLLDNAVIEKYTFDDIAREEARDLIKKAPYDFEYFKKDLGTVQPTDEALWKIFAEKILRESQLRSAPLDRVIADSFEFFFSNANVATIEQARENLVDALFSCADGKRFKNRKLKATEIEELDVEKLRKYVLQGGKEPPQLTLVAGVDPNTSSWYAAVDDKLYAKASVGQYNYIVGGTKRGKKKETQKKEELGENGEQQIEELGGVWRANSTREWLEQAQRIAQTYQRWLRFTRSAKNERRSFDRVVRRQTAVHEIRRTLERRLRKRATFVYEERIVAKTGQPLSERQRERLTRTLAKVRFFFGYGNGGRGYYRGHAGSLKGPMRWMAKQWLAIYALNTAIVNEAFSSQRASPSMIKETEKVALAKSFFDFEPVRYAALLPEQISKRKSKKRREAEAKRKEKREEYLAKLKVNHKK